MTTDRDQWYWDLRKNRAVTAAERGPGDETMGPYATRYEAEHWRDKVAERNKAWDDADDEWERGASDDDG